MRAISQKWTSLIDEFFSTKYIFWHNAKMSSGTYVFFLKFQNRNDFLTEKDILSAIEICWNILFHSDMTLTLILWNYTDLKVIIVLARKWNLFDVNPGFSCPVVEFVLQFPMRYNIRVVEVVEWLLKCEYDGLISDSWACGFHHAFACSCSVLP
jgi:hypothetical protein